MAVCRGQVCDGAAAMSDDRCVAPVDVRKEAQNTAYTHSRSHEQSIILLWLLLVRTEALPI